MSSNTMGTIFTAIIIVLLVASLLIGAIMLEKTRPYVSSTPCDPIEEILIDWSQQYIDRKGDHIPITEIKDICDMYNQYKEQF